MAFISSNEYDVNEILKIYLYLGLNSIIRLDGEIIRKMEHDNYEYGLRFDFVNVIEKDLLKKYLDTLKEQQRELIEKLGSLD